MGILNIGTEVLKNPGTKLALGAIGLAGVAKGIGSSAKEAALDTAFGDPYADEAFMGRPMSPGFLAGAGLGGTAGAVGLGVGALAVGGLIGGGAAAKLISKGTKNRAAAIIGAGAVGAAVGAASGPLKESYDIYGPGPSVGVQAAATGVMGTAGGAIGGLIGSKWGKKGALIGGGIGATIGGLGGAASVPAATLGRIRSNQSTLRTGPNNTSLLTAENLNASGNIVLGMHNSRRGY